MDLAGIVEALNEKGYPRQAVLLQTRGGRKYAQALTNPQWAQNVRAEVGAPLYKALKDLAAMRTSEEKLMAAIHGETSKVSKFTARPYEREALQVRITSQFGLSSLQNAAKLLDSLLSLSIEANAVVYSEVQRLAGDNSDLLFEIYKDKDITKYMEGQSEVDNLIDHRHQLEQRVASCEKTLSANEYVVEVIRKQNFERLLRLQPLFSYDDQITLEENIVNLIAYTRTALSDPDLLKQNYEGRVHHLKNTQKDRVLERARDNIDWGLNLSDHSESSPLSEDRIEAQLNYGTSFLNPGAHNSEEDVHRPDDPLQALLKAPLNVRANFMEIIYEPDLKGFQSTFVGIQQILDGGPITNPNASDLSEMQNDAQFPNIRYSAEALTNLQGIAQKIKIALDMLPDISDLTTPTKLRKKKDLTYEVRELPKNPLDITFGNDASCCIFVPTDIHQMQNGFSIPYFLTDKEIRLFGVYRVEGQKEQRMGLVLGFNTEMEGHPSTKILAANSLELSRFGLAGGTETIRRLSDHVEEWLVGYGKQHGYDGVVMGKHGYNTSVNYSGKAGDTLEGKLIFSGSSTEFYSDIFMPVKDKFDLRTRDKGMYVLWKK